MNSELDTALDVIDDSISLLQQLREALPLLHNMAYTGSGGAASDGSRSTKHDFHGDETGDRRARALWTDTKVWLGLGKGQQAYPRLLNISRRMVRLLASGRPVLDTGRILVSNAELQQALAMQRKRDGSNHPQQPEQSDQ